MTKTQQGWICPKCGRVYGPGALECGPCNTLIQLYGPQISIKWQNGPSKTTGTGGAGPGSPAKRGDDLP